jgi:hypothetical protein
VRASRDSQTFDIGPKAGSEIITQPSGLSFVKQDSIVQILKGIIGYPKPLHLRTTDCGLDVITACDE